jgi:site-specific recombinase XerD
LIAFATPMKFLKSLQTEKAYLYWARYFIRWHGRGGTMRHPRDMGQAEVEAFLTMLAVERQVSPATHRQALNALLFLYRQVLGQDLPWMQAIGRPPERKRVPVVLTVAEVQSLLALVDGVEGTLARLLYGTGMRLAEGLSLRVKDVDFDRHVIVVRSGIRTVQELLGHSDVSTTMIYTHVLKVAAGGTASPLDALAVL